MRQPGITVWYIEGEDGVEVVEYKVWIVDFLRQPGQIAVEDEDGRWEVEVDFYEDDWACGHDQDRHESFRARCQGLRDLFENEPSKRVLVRTMMRLRDVHLPPREFMTDKQIGQRAATKKEAVGSDGWR